MSITAHGKQLRNRRDANEFLYPQHLQMIATAIAQWSTFVLPPPGAHNDSLTNLQPFQLHLANKFKLIGKTLVNEWGPSRQSVRTGEQLVARILGEDGGGYLMLKQDRYMVFLFTNGCLQIEVSKPGDMYADPIMTERVRATCSWTGTIEFDKAMRVLVAEETVAFQSVGSVYAMVATNNGIAFNSIGHGGATLIRDNYSPQVLTSYDRIRETLVAKVPPGRINILSGPPGTGKTFIIRGLIEEVTDVRFAVVQASEVARLAQPGTLPALLNFRNGNQPIVFIIEDAEECLATRDAGNNSAVSALLNMGDGVLGSLIDLRIIATTNTRVQDLDPAIRRPGRLSTICEVGPLAWEQAAKIFEKLTMKGFEGENESYTIAEIYQMATDAGWRGEVKPERRVGFQTEDSPTKNLMNALIDAGYANQPTSEDDYTITEDNQ